ncbi:MAG: hypothetical protein KAV87_65695 [Desulfobacteraceae bacterium]|nr:hypothetical protein [Desulfobacteraceae bacterium]
MKKLSMNYQGKTRLKPDAAMPIRPATMKEKKEEKVEYHKIIITKRYNAIPERYFVSIHCGLLWKDSPLAEFSNFLDAKEYGKKKQ